MRINPIIYNNQNKSIQKDHNPSFGIGIEPKGLKGFTQKVINVAGAQAAKDFLDTMAMHSDEIKNIPDIWEGSKVQIYSVGESSGLSILRIGEHKAHHSLSLFKDGWDTKTIKDGKTFADELIAGIKDLVTQVRKEIGLKPDLVDSTAELLPANLLGRAERIANRINE